MLSKSKAEFCLGEYFRVVSLKLRSTTLRSNEESKKETKKAKILKKEFRESCGDVFNRPDEETSWKYMLTITKSSLSPTN